MTGNLVVGSPATSFEGLLGGWPEAIVDHNLIADVISLYKALFAIWREWTTLTHLASEGKRNTITAVARTPCCNSQNVEDVTEEHATPKMSQNFNLKPALSIHYTDI